MNYCKKCNCYDCNCNTTVNNNVSSDQAGRDGLSAKRILELNGKLPEGASDAQFIEAITGPKGDKGDKGNPGDNGGGIYLITDW